jgi:hypothetical protein
MNCLKATFWASQHYRESLKNKLNCLRDFLFFFLPPENEISQQPSLCTTSFLFNLNFGTKMSSQYFINITKGRLWVPMQCTDKFYHIIYFLVYRCAFTENK